MRGETGTRGTDLESARADLVAGPEAILVADDERRYVDASQAACALLGRSKEAVLALTVDDLAPAEARPWVADAWAAFRASGSQEGTMVIEQPDGSVRHVVFEARANVLPGTHISILRDVTERVTAELELQRAREETALERSRADRTETHLLLALGQIPTVVWSVDPELRYSYASNFRFGLTERSLIGRGMREVFPGDDGEQLERLARQTIATGSRTDGEIVLRFPTGPRICQVSMAPHFDVGGRPNGVIGATTDVTILREAARSATRSRDELLEIVAERTRELSESRRLSDLLFEALGVVTWVEDLRSDERVYISPAPERIVGLTADELIDPARLGSRLHRDDRAAFAADALARADSSEVELRLAGPGPVRWLRRRTTIVRDSDGEPVLRHGFAQDVTALRAAAAERELALRESEARFRGLVERQDAFFWEEDLPVQTIRYVSPQAEQMCGYPPERWYGTRWFWRSVIHPEDRDRVLAAYESSHEGTLEYRVIHADGRTLRLREHSTVLLDPEGRPYRRMGVIVDDTLRHEAEAKRRQLEHRLDELARLESLARMAATTAHDFGNILAGIDVFSVQLERDGTIGERAREDVARIRDAVTQGRDAAAALVALGRMAEPKLVPADVHGALKRLEPMLAGLLGAATRVELDLAAPSSVVEVDAGALERALINLVINARDALPASGGRVRISTGETIEDETTPTAVGIAFRGRYLGIEVADDGAGMDAPTLARAFEPYFTTKPVGKGTGLGLSSVHALARISDGHVHAESAPGLGSRFRICLPLPVPDPAACS